MVRRLDMHKTQGIEHLFSTGMSKRKIARTLGIDRKSVDRHLAEIQSKGAISQEAPIGEAPTGSDASKGAKALTGSEASDRSGIEPLKPAPKPDRSRSQCSQFKQQILAKIEQGLTAQRIYQDLVSDYGFMAKYHSVRR
jgi:transposase